MKFLIVMFLYINTPASSGWQKLHLKNYMTIGIDKMKCIYSKYPNSRRVTIIATNRFCPMQIEYNWYSREWR